MKLLISSIVIAMTLAATTSYADSINERQLQQKERIVQGVKSGQITQKEAFNLRKKQAQFERKELHFKSDGNFTFKERKTLQNNLNPFSKDIYFAKHNKKTRN